ncbi:MAG TPA: hypothetical protein VME63_03980 [Dyella sp.]|nr:hypothetical protein [Dyella sp.]
MFFNRVPITSMSADGPVPIFGHDHLGDDALYRIDTRGMRRLDAY